MSNVKEQFGAHPDLKRLYYTYLAIGAQAEAMAPEDVSLQILSELKKITKALEKAK